MNMHGEKVELKRLVGPPHVKFKLEIRELYIAEDNSNIAKLFGSKISVCFQGYTSFMSSMFGARIISIIPIIWKKK